MKILVLEDDMRRVEKFRENLEKDGVSLTVTCKVAACQQALELIDYDVLFLDHDLDGMVYVPSDGPMPTGWHIAKWLSEHPDRKPSQIFIHSLNEKGRNRMAELIPEAIQLPFAWELVSYDNGLLKYDQFYTQFN